VIARSFIAQRAINNDKVWGRTRRSDLARRCEAQQKPAATCEQFFRDQDSEGCADNGANDADGLASKRKRVECSVVAGPSLEGACPPSAPEAANNIAVRVQDADGRDIDRGEPLLPPCFTQECCRAENRRCRRVLIVENRGHNRPEAGKSSSTAR